MGCDIHMVVQAKPKNETPWYTQGRFRGDRWYTFFAFMNKEVRNYDEVDGFEPRDLPLDTYYKEDSELTARDLGDHSFSWVTCDEYEEALKNAIKHEKSTVMPVCYQAITRFMRTYENHSWETRLIFGFDS